MKPTDDTEDVGALIRSTVAGVHAPDALRSRVAALDAPRRRRAPLRTVAFGFAGAAAALAIALVLVFGGSSTGGPSVADAATAALQPISGPAPAPDPSRDELLTTRIDRPNFPRWEEALALRGTGARPGPAPGGAAAHGDGPPQLPPVGGGLRAAGHGRPAGVGGGPPRRDRRLQGSLGRLRRLHDRRQPAAELARRRAPRRAPR